MYILSLPKMELEWTVLEMMCNKESTSYLVVLNMSLNIELSFMGRDLNGFKSNLKRNSNISDYYDYIFW